jgi:AcrR family transcriptional regulator
MARTVKKPEVRRNEILDAARRSFFSKGYDETTIQQIIDELGIAKGTFYHYFQSKVDLLDALIARTTTGMVESLTPVLDSDLNAIEKFNQIFRDIAALKMANLDFFLVLLKVLFRDENTVLRSKMYESTVRRNTIIFTRVIRQGVQEGLFDASDPEEAAEMILQIGVALNQSISRLLLKRDESPRRLIQVIRRKTRVYEDAIERILGGRKGSLHVYVPNDFEMMVKLMKKNLSESEGLPSQRGGRT